MRSVSAAERLTATGAGERTELGWSKDGATTPTPLRLSPPWKRGRKLRYSYWNMLAMLPAKSLTAMANSMTPKNLRRT